VSMGLVGSAGSPRTLRVLHCTEVSQSMSQMGQSRSFERASGMSAIAPIATESLHCNKLLSSLHRKLRAT
jgi:hypothetical protein